MPSQKTNFHYQISPFHLPNRQAVKFFIEKIFINEKIKLNRLDYIFCTDEYLLQINQQFLKHNFYTDIITFDLSESTAISGEIYISVDRVRENAQQYSASFKSEIHRVIFHGALHLCGYDDKSISKKKAMSLREDYYLHKYFK